MTPVSLICLQVLCVAIVVLGLVLLCASRYRDAALGTVAAVLTVFLALLALGTARRN